MRKLMIKIMFGVFVCFVALQMNPDTKRKVEAGVKPEYMRDVALDEIHFPDELFRKKLKYYVDLNKDGILSREEREKIYYLDLCSYTNGVTKTWSRDMEDMHPFDRGHDVEQDENRCWLMLNFNYDEENYQMTLADQTINVKGVEYFFNLQEVIMSKYELLNGSFKDNMNLRKIWLRCSNSGERSYDTVREQFPASQLTHIELENIAVGTLNVVKIPDLQVLRVILPDGSDRRLKNLNLSKNAKLRELELGNIMPGKLDLRKNKKLISVKVYSGKFEVGQEYGMNLDKSRNRCYHYYLPGRNQKCRISFAKKNKIRTLYYFTRDKEIDITRLTKLEDFQTLESIKAKVKSSWLRKTFTKKRWGCSIVKNGEFLQKIKAVKKKKYTMI